MMVSAVAVDMTMRDLLIGRISHLDDLHVKVQGHTCQRMIAVNSH
jgi:hypothetical protein